jgi:hypothetical protein
MVVYILAFFERGGIDAYNSFSFSGERSVLGGICVFLGFRIRREGGFSIRTREGGCGNGIVFVEDFLGGSF